MRLAWIVLLVLPLSARAQDSTWTGRVVLHGPSWHISSKPWNNATWGLGVELVHSGRRVSLGAILGTYRNSIEATSRYAGVQIAGPTESVVQAGLGVLLATGYDNTMCVVEGTRTCYVFRSRLRYTPMILPALIVGQTTQLRIAGWPVEGGVLHLMISVKIF